MSENILLDTLPETVKVDGKDFFIDTDYRTVIIYEKILNDCSLDNKTKLIDIINLFFTEERPHNSKEALEKIIEFYSCGVKKDNDKNKRKKEPQKNGQITLKPKLIYDFEYDAPYIFGAFYSQYHIDLNEIEYLHWWKFQALFKSLNSDNKIVEIMSIRATDLGKIENSKEKQRIARLQSVYAIPESLTFEEKVARAGAAFGGI